MKRFLLYIAYFVGLLAVFYGGLWGYYAWKMHQCSFALPKDKTVLVIGDSQVQAAVNDSILTNVKNVALAHDNYWSMLRRIELYVEANPQIDTIIIGLTPHTVSRDKDEFFSNYGYMEDVTKHYLPYLNIEDWIFLFSHDATDVLSALVTPISYYLNPSQERIREMGFFEAADYSHLQEDIAEGATRLVEPKDRPLHGNEITLASLDAIKQYAHEHHLTLIGLNTPVHHGSEYFNMENFQQLMSTRYADLPLLDYMDFPIPDSCRRDVNHLNELGACWFSNILAKNWKE